MLPFRPNIAAMAPYVPGEQPPAGHNVIKLNTNENPYPPSMKVVEAICSEMGLDGHRLRLYPDPKALALRQAAADVYGFEVEQVLHGNGSDELLALLCRAFVGEGEPVAYPYPTYVLYETIAHQQGARILQADFDRQFTLPKQLFGCGAKVVFLAAPNSPSGTTYTEEELRWLAASLSNGILVLDEAYAEFADHNHLSLAREVENVVVLRTFSKSHSLAGMRLGLLFGNAALIEGLVKVKDSYNLDRLAIAAGAAALRDTAWVARHVQQVRATRARLSQGLNDLGFEVLPSQSNFVFTRLKDAAQAAGAYRFLKALGILVRYFPARLLDDGLRISVGTDLECDVVIAALREYLNHG